MLLNDDYSVLFWYQKTESNQIGELALHRKDSTRNVSRFLNLQWRFTSFYSEWGFFAVTEISSKKENEILRQ